MMTQTLESQESRIGRANRATIQKTKLIQGIGLHSGEEVHLKISPARAGNGLVFRASGSQKGDIPVTPFNVVDTLQAVTLGNSNWRISTVEHLLAGLATAGITDADFEIDAPEIPIMDGSARPFYEAIQEAGVQDLGVPCEPIVINTPVWVVEGDKYVIALPHDGFRVTYTINFNHPMLNGRTLNMDLSTQMCAEEILPARTFGFFKEAEALKAKGLALGASLDNAVVMTDDGYMNESLRFENECVRHKALDLIGDLYLMGRPIQAHIIASKAGHKLDVALGKNILNAKAKDELTARRRVPVESAAVRSSLN